MSAEADASVDAEVAVEPAQRDADAARPGRSKRGRVGTTVGHILLEARLGVGGMGEVYRGFDRKLERRVAVKTIRARHRLSAEMKARFLREARLLSRLEHPGICQIYDLLEGEDTDFLILEFVEGETLHERLKYGISYEHKLDLAEKVARVLAVAHEQKVVHRDLKPDNIMVTPDGGVKVLDFGIARTVGEQRPRLDVDASVPPVATGEETQVRHSVYVPTEIRDEDYEDEDGPTEFVTGPRIGDSETEILADGTMLTQDGLVVGTARYMSPEQARGRKVDAASDMYSFGIMLQEMLTEERAYAKAPVLEMLVKVSRAETLPLPEGLDPDLARLIEDLKSLDTHRRPSAQEAAERLRWILDKPQRLRRKKLIIAGVGSAFLLLLALLVVVTFLAVRATHAREEAERRRGQAENLINFMLGDLYDKLEGVGRQDILGDVGDRALEYFESVPDAALSPEERFQRVEALNRIGQVHMAQGDQPAAMATFEQAETVAQQLTEADPSQTEWQVALGAARFWVGLMHLRRNELDEAEEKFLAYMATARQVAENEPDKPEWQMELAYAHGNLADVEKARGDSEAVLAAHQRALEIKLEVTQQHPENLDWQASLAESYNSLGKVLRDLARLQEALACSRSALEITQKLAAAAPEDANWQERLAARHFFLGSLLMVTGETQKARQHLQIDLEAIERFARLDPTNQAWERGVAISQGTYGMVLIRLGQTEPALAYLERSSSTLEALVAADAEHSDSVEDLVRIRHFMALALERAGRLDEALGQVAGGLALLDELDQEAQRLPRLRLQRALLQLRRGCLLELQGKDRQAQVSWLEARRLLEPLAANSKNFNYLAPWAELLIHRQERQEAEQVLALLNSFGYDEPLLSQLARENGYRAPAP